MSASLFNLDGQYAPQKGGAYPMRLEFLDAAGAAANLAGTLELRVLGRDQLALLTKAFAVAGNVAQLTITDAELAALPADMLGYDVRNVISAVPYLVIGGGFNLLPAGSGRRHGLTQLRLTYGSVNMQLVVTGVPGSPGAAGPAGAKGLTGPQGPGSTIVTLRESGSIPVPPLAVAYKCEIFGQGGAGGSGRKGAVGTVRCGGGAAGVGMYVQLSGTTSDLDASVACIVPGAPAGGAAVTDDDTDGNSGEFPTDTSVLLGGILLAAKGANPGSGGTSSIGFGGSKINRPTVQAIEPAVIAIAATNGCSSQSGGPGTSGPNPTNFMAGYSGSGGGITAANVASAGGNGGYAYMFSNTLFARGVGGGIGSAGTQATASLGFNGSPGGGGGGSSVTGDGGAGADGVGYGGGGGGGGAATNGVGNSGKGGDGTAGAVRMTFYF